MIKPSRIRDYAAVYPDAERSLAAWLKIARIARWNSLHEVREYASTADGVIVKSERTVTVFNIRGNHYRLITAIHYNRKMIFVLRFLTHVEYDKSKWKEEL